jgi:hypothetical protein
LCFQWLAKEFAKERAWKVKTAKRYAVAAQKSERDLEARVAVRAREEEKALRKRAAWIAKEVGGRVWAARLGGCGGAGNGGRAGG